MAKWQKENDLIEKKKDDFGSWLQFNCIPLHKLAGDYKYTHNDGKDVRKKLLCDTNNIFYIHWACNEEGLTDGVSDFAVSYRNRFDEKMAQQGYVKYPQDFE